RPPRWHIIPDVAFASDPNHTDRVRTGQRSGSRWLRREPGAPGRQHYRLRALRIRDRGDVRFQIHQLGCVSPPAIGIGTGPAQLDPDIVAVDPAELLEALLERRDKGLPFGIPLRTAARQETDPTHLIGLLRLRHKRPRRCRATDKRDERATFHSITSSARAMSVGGTVRPSAFAVLRLMMSSIFVGCSTGSSAGCAPFKILST